MLVQVQKDFHQPFFIAIDQLADLGSERHLRLLSSRCGSDKFRGGGQKDHGETESKRSQGFGFHLYGVLKALVGANISEKIVVEAKSVIR
jgi:hypothetical protein